MMTALAEIDITTKAEVLLEALPYIQRFHGSTFVVKYGGSFMDDPDPAMRASVATDIVFLNAVGIHVVVVHGGGKAISRAMAASGLEPHFNHGLRVTDAETVKIVEKTLNEEVNPQICDLIRTQGGTPHGLHGNVVLLASRKRMIIDGEPVDLGFVGEIEHVKSKLAHKALKSREIPVISPIAADDRGQLYNTNADEAAGRVAAALKARRLVYLCDVPGLLRDPADAGSIISTLKADEVDHYKRSGVISSGMRPKVDSAVQALREGVHRVHFVDGRMPHSILLEIFTHRGIGTEIVHP